MKGLNARRRVQILGPTSASVLSLQGRRESNQDRATAIETSVGGRRAWVLAVADGMGGLRDGERAAEAGLAEVVRMAREVLPACGPTPAAVRRAVFEGFQAANRAVWHLGAATGQTGQVGTTLVCAVAFDGRFLVAHAGDSRCYYISDVEVKRLTDDHSSVQELVRRGQLTPEAAARSPFRNQLTNCLGEGDAIHVEFTPGPECFAVVDEPAVLLLCSDGLHGDLQEADLAMWLRHTPSLGRACEGLVATALSRGSTDNVTLAVVEFGRLRRKRRHLPAPPPIERILDGSAARPAVRRSTSRGRRLRVVGAVAALLLAGVAVVAGIGVWHGVTPHQAVAWVTPWSSRPAAAPAGTAEPARVPASMPQAEPPAGAKATLPPDLQTPSAPVEEVRGEAALLDGSDVQPEPTAPPRVRVQPSGEPWSEGNPSVVSPRVESAPSVGVPPVGADPGRAGAPGYPARPLPAGEGPAAPLGLPASPSGSDDSRATPLPTRVPGDAGERKSPAPESPSTERKPAVAQLPKVQCIWNEADRRLECRRGASVGPKEGGSFRLDVAWDEEFRNAVGSCSALQFNRPLVSCAIGAEEDVDVIYWRVRDVSRGAPGEIVEHGEVIIDQRGR